METPPIWSENLVRNFERIIEWADAITIMCDISSTNYEHYMNRVAYKIKEDELQHVITNLGANFCALIKWICVGIDHLNSNPRLPVASQMNEKYELKKFQDTWNIHVCSERQILDELKKVCCAIATAAKESLKIFHDEQSDPYSSYSDYSEETSSTEEEEEEEEEKRERRPRRKVTPKSSEVDVD